MDNNQLLVEVKYYSGGKYLMSVWSNVYPQYKEGESFFLRTIPTNRERTRRPAQQFTERFYLIEKVHHIALEQLHAPGSFVLTVEVFLHEPAIDTFED